MDDATIVETGDRCFRILKSRYAFDVAERDDIRQEILMALLRASKSFDPTKGTWFRYAYRFAIGAVQSFFRDGIRIAESWDSTRSEVIRTVPYESVDAGDADEYAAIELEEGLKLFSIRERQLIVLLMIGYSITQAARIIGISTHTASRIIADLRIKNTPFSFSVHTDSQRMRRAA